MYSIIHDYPVLFLVFIGILSFSFIMIIALTLDSVEKALFLVDEDEYEEVLAKRHEKRMERRFTGEKY